MDKYTVLKHHFGYASFRGGQERLIDAVLDGRDVLGIMPTGGGKSLCYQIPALLLPGMTVVVSPLISLMKDQVMALKNAGVAAAYVNSSLTGEQLARVYDNIRRGVYKLLYIAPERLQSDGFAELARRLPIALLAVDEAHCISQWGNDFRPSYLRIADFIRGLPTRPVVAAFTATATEQVRRDIEEKLEMRAPLRVVTGFDRPNLRFEVLRPRQRPAALLELVEKRRREKRDHLLPDPQQRRKGLRAAARARRPRDPLPRRPFGCGAAAQSGGFRVRPLPGHRGDQRLWNGYRQIQRFVCDPLQYADESGGVLSGGGARGAGRRAGRVPSAVRAERRPDGENAHRFYRRRRGGRGNAGDDAPPRVRAAGSDACLLQDDQMPARLHSGLLRAGARGSLRKLRELSDGFPAGGHHG